MCDALDNRPNEDVKADIRPHIQKQIQDDRRLAAPDPAGNRTDLGQWCEWNASRQLIGAGYQLIGPRFIR